MVGLLALASAGADDAALPGPPALPGADPAPAAAVADSPVVTVKFAKTDLADAVKQLHDLTGADLVVGAGVSGSVTASFDSERLDKVLKFLGLALHFQVVRNDTAYILKPIKADDPATPAADAAPAIGAETLLPGDAPTAPLRDAGGQAAPLANTAAAPPANNTTRVTIPLNYLSPEAAATMLGGGYVDSNGVYHSPQEIQAALQAQQQSWGAPQQSAGDPYRNLPPDARVMPNGVIALPNGNTVLPNGTVITRGGAVIQPTQTVYPINSGVPYANGPGGYQSYPAQQAPVLRGTVGGTPFMIGPDGTTVVSPRSINLGIGQLLLAPIVLGGGQSQSPSSMYMPITTGGGQTMRYQPYNTAPRLYSPNPISYSTPVQYGPPSYTMTGPMGAFGSAVGGVTTTPTPGVAITTPAGRVVTPTVIYQGQQTQPQRQQPDKQQQQNGQ
jgi:hypothetical protein